MDQSALYAAIRARGAMPLMLPKTRSRARCGDAVVAAGGRRGVRSVAVVVADRVELPGPLGIDAGVAAPGGVEVLGADELLVAHRGVERFAGGALAVPAGDLLVGELAVLGGVAVLAGPVREAQALRPDARVDDPDDDVLAGAADAAELIPEAARRGQAEEVRRRRRVDRVELVRRDRRDARLGGQLGRLGLGQLRGEAVVRVDVAVELRPADRGHGRVVLALEVARVGDDVAGVRVDLLALLGRRGLEALHAAFVGDDRLVHHLDDVDAVLRRRHRRLRASRRGRLRRARCTRQQGDEQGRRRDERDELPSTHGPSERESRDPIASCPRITRGPWEGAAEAHRSANCRRGTPPTQETNLPHSCAACPAGLHRVPPRGVPADASGAPTHRILRVRGRAAAVAAAEPCGLRPTRRRASRRVAGGRRCRRGATRGSARPPRHDAPIRSSKPGWIRRAARCPGGG